MMQTGTSRGQYLTRAGVFTSVSSQSTVLVLDQFTGTNGTTASSHAISPTNLPATSWTIYPASNSWTIQNNKMNSGDGTGANANAIYCNCGNANCTVSCDITIPASGAGNNLGLMIRGTDPENGVIAFLIQGSGIAIYTVASNTYTQRSLISFTVSLGQTYTLTVSANSSNLITASVGATSTTYTTSLFSANTVQAITTSRPANGNTFIFDNFEVTTP